MSVRKIYSQKEDDEEVRLRLTPQLIDTLVTLATKKQ